MDADQVGIYTVLTEYILHISGLIRVTLNLLHYARLFLSTAVSYQISTVSTVKFRDRHPHLM